MSSFRVESHFLHFQAKLQQVMLLYAARSNDSAAEHLFHVGNSLELDVTSGREKTNLEMDVYRQALSVGGEQLLPTG